MHLARGFYVSCSVLVLSADTADGLNQYRYHSPILTFGLSQTMEQNFNLQLASETITNDAKLLGVTVDELQRICVRVNAKVSQQSRLCLQLTYQIVLSSKVLAEQLDWPMWESTQVTFSDYLWEETCLECFITGRSINCEESISNQQTESYIEINASPNGRYALYQFERYRTPATLPPPRLKKPDGHTLANIDWMPHTEPSVDPTKAQLPDPLSASQPSYHYQRQYSVPLKRTGSRQYTIESLTIEKIHPCVILWFGETALYFASSHATPPDFHNQDYWSVFE